MITTSTPYKLAEIIRDTWPQLYRPSKLTYNKLPINTPQNFTKNHMKFTVYSKDGCPYCSKVEQVLQLSELQYVVYKLHQDFTKEEFYSEFGPGSTFPQVIMNDQHLGGCTDTVKYLKENQII